MLAGEVILFLGAGASLTSTNKSGEKICLGNALKDKISEKFHLSTTETDTLGDIYNIAKKNAQQVTCTTYYLENLETRPHLMNTYHSESTHGKEYIQQTSMTPLRTQKKSLNVPAQKLIKNTRL
nr:hypothetical protein [Pseudomonas aeruginosa]